MLVRFQERIEDMKDWRVEEHNAKLCGPLFVIGLLLIAVLVGPLICGCTPTEGVESDDEDKVASASTTATDDMRQAWQEEHGPMLQPGQFVEVESLDRDRSGLTHTNKMLLDLATGVLYLRCSSYGIAGLNGSVTPYLDSDGEVKILGGAELEAWRQAAIADGTWDPDWMPEQSDGKEGDAA